MVKKGVLVLLVLSIFIMSLSVVYGETVTYRKNTITWDNFKFPNEPYAVNGPGFSASFSFCYQNPSHAHCKINGSYDVGAVFVAQDFNFIVWKIVAPNMTGANFCNLTNSTNTSNTTISIEFDSDSNRNTGCNSFGGGGCAGYPGSEYRLVLNASGEGNVSQINAQKTAFVAANNIVLLTNITRPCSINPTIIYMALNKSYITNLTGVQFQIEVKNVSGFPRDVLGGFSEGAFEDKLRMNKSTFDPMFITQGCGSFRNTNAPACVNNTVGARCRWESDFNDCFPDMFGEGGTGMGATAYSCNEMCGACTTQNTCTGNPQCQWNANIFNPKRGTNGACIENPNKVDLFTRMGGPTCDEDCDACMTNYTCVNSKYPDPTGLGGAGCKWVTDTVIGDRWCDTTAFDEAEFICSISYPERCFTQADCTGKGTWDSTDLYCKGAGEVCYNGEDDDGDNKIDCDDSNCYAIADNCGGDIDTLTAGRGEGEMDPVKIMKEGLMGDLAGAPTQIGSESSETAQFTGNNSVIDILGFAIADMYEAFGFGIGVRNFTPSTYCNSSGGKGGGVYYYLIDADNNESTGCTANISGTNYNGFDYKFVYKLNNSGGRFVETMKTYRCLNQSTTNFGLFPYMVFPPPSPPGQIEGYMQCTMANAVIVSVEKSELANPKTTIRFSVATGEVNSTGHGVTLAQANDTLLNMYYKPGTIDFKPKDCFSNPTACGSRFSIIGGGKFMPFQDCMSNEDTDGNSYAGCADPFCVNFPRCIGSSTRYNLSNDKSAPTIISNSVQTYSDFAFVNWITDEPSNGTVKFYNTDTNCNTLNTSQVDQPPFEIDRYRTFHGMPFQSTIWGFTLVASRDYFYKLESCDQAGNCAVSGCLNFTTTGATTSKKVPLKFIFDNATTDPLLNLSNIKIDNGTNNITFNSGNLSNLSSFATNATLIFDSPANWSIKLEGVDLAKTLSANLSGGFNVTNASSNTYVGLSGSKWQELAQSLGVDTILLTIPEGGDNLYKCQENNLSNCQSVTNLGNKTEGGAGYANTTWRIPASLGFTTYYNKGGGGGTSPSGGGTGTPIYTGTAYTKTLSTTAATTVTLKEQDSVTYSYSGKTHKMTINTIYPTSKRIKATVESVTQTVYLDKDTPKDIDTDLNNKNDLRLILKEITTTTADISMLLLEEEAAGQPQEATKEEATTEPETTGEEITQLEEEKTITPETGAEKVAAKLEEVKKDKKSNLIIGAVIIAALIVVLIYLSIMTKKKK